MGTQNRDTPLVLEWEGDILLNFCYNISLYSLDLSTPQQKEAVLAIFDEYVSLYGPRLNWTSNPVTDRWKPLKGNVDNYVTPHEWLMSREESKGFAFQYHGGAKETDAADVSFKVLAEDRGGVANRDLSYLSCRFPAADVRNGTVDLADLMHRWCALLKPWHGRGGCSAGWGQGCSMRPLIYDTLARMLRSYPGLQFDSVTETLYDPRHQAGLYNGPRCADWLIALSDPFLEKLGGLNAVMEAMQPCPVLPYEGGAVLQAGNAPAPGNDGDPHSLPDYLRLGQVIEPVRAKNLHHIIYVSDDTAPAGFKEAQDLTDAWCMRFSGGAAAQNSPTQGL